MRLLPCRKSYYCRRTPDKKMDVHMFEKKTTEKDSVKAAQYPTRSKIMTHESQNLIDMNNYIAIEMLTKLGLGTPTQDQIDLMESIVSTAMVKKKVVLDARLTDREHHFLYWIARGKTMYEAGELLGLSLAITDKYHNEIRRKLQCRTLSQAIFEGLRFGEILNKQVAYS